MSDSPVTARIEASIRGWQGWLSDLVGGRDVTRWQGWSMQRYLPALLAAQNQGGISIAPDEQIVASWPSLIWDDIPFTPPPPQTSTPGQSTSTLARPPANPANSAPISHALGNWRGALMVLTDRQILISREDPGRTCQVLAVDRRNLASVSPRHFKAAWGDGASATDGFELRIRNLAGSENQLAFRLVATPTTLSLAGLLENSGLPLSAPAADFSLNATSAFPLVAAPAEAVPAPPVGPPPPPPPTTRPVPPPPPMPATPPPPPAPSLANATVISPLPTPAAPPVPATPPPAPAPILANATVISPLPTPVTSPVFGSFATAAFSPPPPAGTSTEIPRVPPPPVGATTTEAPTAITAAGARPPASPGRNGLLVGVISALVVILVAGGGSVAYLLSRGALAFPGTAPAATAISTPTSASTAAAPSSAASSRRSTPTPTPTPTLNPREQALKQLNTARDQSLEGLQLDGRWILQVGSKYEGVTDPRETTASGSHTFMLPDIWATHESLAQTLDRQGSVLLLQATDFGRQVSLPGVTWVTVVDPVGSPVTDYDSGVAQCATLFPALSGDDLANVCMPRQLRPPFSG